jgi:succinate dehydrogenase / fumarate reductase iron-sulfur subunit
MKLKVFRSNGNGDVKYDVFEVEPRPGMNVLGALFFVQDKLDPSLSFRYSCRGAVCGSCAMMINKFPSLACRTQVGALLEGINGNELKLFPAIEGGEPWDPKTEILVEPLPHLPVIKDLIVDMKKFYRTYKAIEPVFKPDNEHPQKERKMKPENVKELENYTNCILCAACFGACPVEIRLPNFLGPAALAKLYRFAIDPREEKEEYRLKLADRPDGWYGCEFHANCMRVCPKGVTPNLAIGKARQKLNGLEGRK